MSDPSAVNPPDPQTKCRLLSLAAEIRTYIYELVLTVPPNDDGVVSVASLQSRRFYADFIRTYNASRSVCPKQQKPEPNPNETVLHLLETCRQVYEEAAGIFYTQNRIQLSGGLKDCDKFVDPLSQARLKNIRFLAIPALDIPQAALIVASRGLAKLPNLEKLVLTSLFLCNERSPYISEAAAFKEFFKALENLAGVKQVIIEVEGHGKTSSEQYASQLNASIAELQLKETPYVVATARRPSLKDVGIGG